MNHRRTPVRRAPVRRTLVRLALTLAAIFVAWRLTAELIEPHLLLRLRPPSALIEAPGPAGTLLRLHSDARPHVGKISGLQKGLVWVHQGRALIEEGYGFGCPIVMIDGQAYVSRHARIEAVPLPGGPGPGGPGPGGPGAAGTRLIKRYDMDTIDTPIRLLRRKYQPVPSIGVVTVQYDIYPQGWIDVEVDFSQINRDWTQAYLMNEQGARNFVRYSDSSGNDLHAGEIGIWEQIDGPAHRACLSRQSGDLEFCVEPEETPIVYYGRERYNQRNWRGLYYLSWAGVDIELEAPRHAYRYRVVLEVR